MRMKKRVLAGNCVEAQNVKNTAFFHADRKRERERETKAYVLHEIATVHVLRMVMQARYSLLI